MGITNKMPGTLTAALALFLIFSLPVRAMEGLPPGTDEALENLQSTMYPPWAYNVTVSPDPPRAGEEISITAEIYNDANTTRDQTVGAWLMYSLDHGDSWETVEMDGVQEGKLWNAEIPPQDSGVEILYGFRAKDSSGNIFTETPCLVDQWPPKDDPCMFDLAVDEPPVDDEDNLVPDDFDIHAFRGGVDEDNLYLQIQVQGEIKAGSISPIYVHLYGFGVANMDRGDPTNIVSQGFLGVYAPNAASFTYLPCMTIFERAGEAVFDYRNISCYKDDDGDSVWFRIKNDQVGPTPHGHLKIIAATGAVTSITPLAGLPYDYSHVSSLAIHKERWLKIP